MIPGDSGTTASLSPGGSVSSNIDFGGDDDWFSISLVGGREYRFDLTSGLNGGGGTLADPFLRLYDSSGVFVDGDDDGGLFFSSRLFFTPTADGTYFLSARAAGSSGQGSYKLTATTASETPNLAPTGNSPISD